MEPKPIVELHAFRHPTDEQLRHVDIFFSNYYNLQSVYFEFGWEPFMPMFHHHHHHHHHRRRHRHRHCHRHRHRHHHHHHHHHHH